MSSERVSHTVSFRLIQRVISNKISDRFAGHFGVFSRSKIKAIRSIRPIDHDDIIFRRLPILTKLKSIKMKINFNLKKS